MQFRHIWLLNPLLCFLCSPLVLSPCVCIWEQKQTVAVGCSKASTRLNEDFLHEGTRNLYNLRAVHQLHSSYSNPCHLPDYFHIKHTGLLAEVKSGTMVFIWVAWQCLSTGCASKRAGENRRIPLILSNWVAAFAAVHRMWETRDKKTSIYSPLPSPPLSAPPLSALLFPRMQLCELHALSLSRPSLSYSCLGFFWYFIQSYKKQKKVTALICCRPIWQTCNAMISQTGGKCERNVYLVIIHLF